MWILEEAELPVYVWLYNVVEILFHLVNFGGRYYYIWPGFQWMDRIFTAKTKVGSSKDVYERLVKKRKKPGFFQLLATQTVSAVWHGLYPGYIIFFVQSALMIAGSRVLYQWEKAIPSNMGLVKKALALMNFVYTLLVLNYSCVGFMVLSKQETLASYGSVYYIGTILPVALIMLGYIIPVKPARSKDRKEK